MIAGEVFTHGVVLMSSLSDTAGLSPFGFFGFEPGAVVYDGSGRDDPGVLYHACYAYWPEDVEVTDLPGSIHSIQSDRNRLGSGVVSIKPKMPEK